MSEAIPSHLWSLSRCSPNEECLRLLEQLHDEFPSTTAGIEELRRRERLYRLVAEYSSDLICLHNTEGILTYMSPSVMELLGYGREDLLGTTPYSLIHPEDITAILEKIRTELVHTESVILQYRFRMKNGEYIWLETKVSALFREDGAIFAYLTSSRDSSARKSALDMAALHESRLSATRMLGHIGSWEFHLSSRTFTWSEETAGIFGFSHDKPPITFRDFLKAVPECEHLHIYRLIRQAARGLTRNCELQIVMPSGERKHIHASCRPVVDENGDTIILFGTVVDITERKLAQERMLYLSTHDSITSLPNRLKFREQLIRHLEQLDEATDPCAAVAVFDLDRFKLINDMLGYPVGDAVLRKIGKAMLRSMKAGDFAARLGGDEFVVLFTHTNGSQDALKRANSMIELITGTYRIGSHEVAVGASAGVSLYPHDGIDADTLMKSADIALQQSKDSGRNQARLFSPTLRVQMMERMLLEKYLRKALERQELYIEYQPKFNVHAGVMSGMEALLRWNSPELGRVSPNQFIPIAEENGLIRPIGEWVLRQACMQMRQWQQAGFEPVPISVNISYRQMQQAGFCDRVHSILQETGLDPALLELELTESGVMANLEASTELLHELKKLGLSLSIDDFGTGFSSLSYLQHFPIDKLKIDASFVREIPNSTKSMALTEAIVMLARSFRMRVVAEGVENEDQLLFIKSMGVGTVQGYYFSKPILPDEVRKYFKAGRQGA